jgi:PAS domain S-box-containing protein
MKLPSGSAGTAPSAQEQRMLSAWVEQEPRYGLVFLDAEGTVTGLTAAAEQLLGYRPADLVGRPLSTLFTRGDQTLQLPMHEMTVAKRLGYSEDDRWHRRKDGSLVWIGGALTRIRDAAGKLVGFVKILRDRTDTRTQVEALQNRAAAHKMEQDRLAARTRATAATLATSIGMVSSALGKLPSADQGVRDQLETGMKTQVALLARLVNEMRDALPDAAPDPGFAMLQLQELLSQAVAAYAPAAAAAGVGLALLAPAGPILLRADEQRLRQSLLTLIGNAIRYTPEGGKVWVKATVETDVAAVRIEDTGVGIEGHLLPDIFGLFTQASSVNRAAGALAGGALRLVHDTVLLHGGTIEVRSDGVGKGAEFGLRLPLPSAPA